MSFLGSTSTFGATSTPAKPGMFSNFTTGTGTTGTATAFGQPAATTAATFGFGSATTTASGLGGFGAFGTNTATTTVPSLFGATNFSTGFGGFGSTAVSSAAPSFSANFNPPAATSAFNAFATNTATTSVAPNFSFNTFGTGFGKVATSTVTPGFSGFGGNTAFMLGQPQQQAPQISPDEAFAQSIFNVSIYGDERDIIIAKWNYLQAMWGTGKSFYSQNALPVEITPHNYLCRFKAMGYSRLPGKDNKMGLVALNFNKTIAEVSAHQAQVVNALNGIFGNKPNLLVNIDSIKEHEEKKCQMVMYLEERSQIAPNETRRILATDLANFLNQANIKPQLSNMGITDVLALVLPDEDQLKEYLENAPKGIDPRMWRQAIIDNPNVSKFIPVPMVGFIDLKWRIKCQENETETHTLYLRKVEKDLTELKQRHAVATAKIMEHKRKIAELSHDILKIIVKQECTRKVGLALTAEEEALRTKLENMQALFSAPTQYKGRLSELLSQMRMQRNQYALTGASEYTIDKDSEEEMKTFLCMQQKAMEALTNIVTKDLKALQIIIDGMPELVRA